ncbi:GspH/FimT family pseudopilin [Marinicella sp. W31]|uniref:GspH/FimT family pseudopilin n=1 Tax=Marinicella sp. W31 TaxID=3023713 RepID=UPI003757E3E6
MRIHRQRGFTFIELVIALVIITLLIAWGIPNYRNLKLRQDFTSYANEAVYSINLARAEAIRRGTNVSIIRAGGNWDDGWQVIVVADGTILAQQDAFSGGFEMNLTVGVDTDLEFDNLGGLINQPVAFELSHDDSTEGRRIQLLASGQARVVVL